ncbi:MAG: cysteine desulfurase family protein [Candidatus Woesearchaeota archaeon]
MIYFDNASTTPVDKKVIDIMLPYFNLYYGNPGSMHNKGLIALNAIYDSRKKVAEILNCDTKEIIFTGSGTESDNLAILGFARKNKNKGNHIIISTIEHPAVKESALHLIEEGFEVSFVNVDKDGLVDLNELKNLIRNDTILVSIIYANNEIGVVQDLKEISKICHEKNVVFHTDACQAPQYLDIDVKNLDVDMMSLNGSKINGPKGIGCLFVKKGILLESIIYGGGQENNLRSGTENVPLIVGFAKALEIVTNEKEENFKHVKELQKKLIDDLLKIPETKLNGSLEKRLPNNVNISFLNVEGESIILMLNEEEIYVSTGSACSSKSLEPSHVLLALGLPHELAHSSIRFTLNKFNTIEEVKIVVEKIKEIVEQLRKMSPMHQSLKELGY